MKILYVAKHNSGDNDDEGAIAYALRVLGHDVDLVNERIGRSAINMRADFLLCHKWDDYEAISRVKIPKVFWFFDLIESDDWHLKARGAERAAWANKMAELCDLGFLTDGDWVARDATGKLHHLLQGADERFVGPGSAAEKTIDVLFFGSTIHGGKRISHVEELKKRLPQLGLRFVACGHHPKDRKHGRELANLIAQAKLVIAPDGPVSDLYWSNRVYLTIGFAGCLLHPWCAKLATHYEDWEDLVFYRSRDEALELMARLAQDQAATATIGHFGCETTKRRHLYRHRCEELVKIVRERLKI